MPVAAPESCEAMRREVDEVVCAHVPEPFMAVGQWYQDFSQTTDDEVHELLRRGREGNAQTHLTGQPGDRPLQIARAGASYWWRKCSVWKMELRPRKPARISARAPRYSGSAPRHTPPNPPLKLVEHIRGSPQNRQVDVAEQGRVGIGRDLQMLGGHY